MAESVWINAKTGRAYVLGGSHPPVNDPRAWARRDALEALRRLQEQPRYTHAGATTAESKQYLAEVKSIISRVRK